MSYAPRGIEREAVEILRHVPPSRSALIPQVACYSTGFKVAPPTAAHLPTAARVAERPQIPTCGPRRSLRSCSWEGSLRQEYLSLTLFGNNGTHIPR